MLVRSCEDFRHSGNLAYFSYIPLSDDRLYVGKDHKDGKRSGELAYDQLTISTMVLCLNLRQILLRE